MNQNTRGDFSKASVPGNIVRLAGPMVIALLVNVLYSMVDRIFIGHIPVIGRDALTGIGLTFPVIMLVSAFQNLCTTGSAPLFALARGRGDDAEAGKMMGNAFALLMLFSVVLVAAMYALKRPLLMFIGASADTFGYADAYLDIYLIGTPFMMTSIGLNPFLNAQGFPRIGMMTVLLGAGLNLLLDPFLIFTLGMGVRGAALATILSQGVGAFWVILFLTGRRPSIQLQTKCIRLERRRTGRILSLGVSGFAISVTNSAVSMACNTCLATLGGDLWIGAMSIVKTLSEVVLQPIQGVATGAQPVLGYNYGAGEYGRTCSAILWTSGMSFACTVIAQFTLMAFPSTFARLFSSDTVLIEAASRGIRWYFCLFIFVSLQISAQNAFLALGMTRYALAFTLFRKAVLLIPLTLLMPRIAGLGVMGVFLAEPVSELIGGCTCYLVMYRKVFRKLRKMTYAAAERTI